MSSTNDAHQARRVPPRKPRGLGADGAPLESAILRQIREALAVLPGVTVWRNNSGVLRDAHGTHLRYGLGEGSADLVGLVTVPSFRLAYEDSPPVFDNVRIGRFFALEIKRPGARTTPAQDAWIAHVRKLGGYACVVRDVAEAMAAVEEARRV